MWYLPENSEHKVVHLKRRATVIRAIREFFDAQGFIHVETPVMQVTPGADVHIHGYCVENGLYLQNSPEFAMKRLLADGCEKIYQICPVFRKEERTKLHNPEFTMLEWYRAGADYIDIMTDCEGLLRSLNVERFEYGGRSCDPHAEWQKISVTVAFEDYAGIDLTACLEDVSAFRAAADGIGIRTIDTDQWDDVFHAVMAEKIEPHLGMDVPCILYDYPACMAALSRKKPGDERFAERFELYVCGVELANAYSELTDAAEQRARFEFDMALKQDLYGESYPIDEAFLQALECGMPDSGGIALGVDRLVMLACGDAL